MKRLTVASFFAWAFACAMAQQWIDASGTEFVGNCAPGQKFRMAKLLVGECNENGHIEVTGCISFENKSVVVKPGKEVEQYGIYVYKCELDGKSAKFYRTHCLDWDNKRMKDKDVRMAEDGSRVECHLEKDVYHRYSFGAKNGKQRKVGEKFVENHVVYEVVLEMGKRVQKAIACAPFGTMDNQMEPGDKKQLGTVMYLCAMENSKLLLRPVGCVTADGWVVRPGDKIETADGFQYRCAKAENMMMLRNEKRHKCKPSEGSAAIAPNAEYVDKSAKMIYRCMRSDEEKDRVYLMPAGCLLPNGEKLKIGETVNEPGDKVFVCVLRLDGTTRVEEQDQKEMGCSLNMHRFKHGEDYSPPDGSIFKCKFGVVSKSACYWRQEQLSLAVGRSLEKLNHGGVVCPLSDGLVGLLEEARLSLPS